MPAMKTAPRRAACAAALSALLALLLGACSTKDGYLITQQAQMSECRKIPDLAERQRCEKDASRSYEHYQAEREAAAKKAPN